METKTTSINLSEAERLASAFGGALLAAYGISQRSKSGAMIAAAGGALIVRGATGYCPGYAAAGIDTRRGDTRSALAGSKGTSVETAVTIAKPHDELYRFWRNLENLPRIMPHLVSVRDLGDSRSHWVAKAPGGRTVEWDAEIINDVENQRIGWRSLNDADVDHAGSVEFEPTGDGRSTRLTVTMQYAPIAGRLGTAVAKLLGEDPELKIAEDLQRFKESMEAGKAVTPGL
jgi:uncharacterized membrane protein